MQLYEVGPIELPQEPEHLLLSPYIERVGVFHPDFETRYKRLPNANIGPGGNLRLMMRMSDDEFGAPTTNHRYLKDKDTLTNGLAIIRSSLHTNPHLYAEDTVDWGGLAQGLVEEVSLRDMTYLRSTIDITLQAAVCCSLLANSIQARQQFIQSVYDARIAGRLARAIRDSPLSYIDGQSPDSHVYHLGCFAEAFELSSPDVKTYVELLDANMTAMRSDARAKRLGKTMRHAYEQGEVGNELLSEAQRAGLTGNEAETISPDPHKIERFALQEVLIQEIVDELFGSTTIQNSPFARALQEMRRNGSFTAEQLHADIRETIKKLSAPIVVLYKLPEVITEHSQLSQKQVMALRFHEIINETNRLGKVANYVSYRSRPFSAKRIQDIYTISHEGAATPGQVEALLDHVMHAARIYKDQTGDTPTAEELYRLTLSERKYLIRLAMSNIKYFGSLRTKGYFNRGDLTQSANNCQLYRNTAGELKLRNPLVDPDMSDVPTAHNGVTLGCPAGKVSSHTIQHETRQGAATNNFVDYIVEAAIHEAYGRNIFQLELEKVA